MRNVFLLQRISRPFPPGVEAGRPAKKTGLELVLMHIVDDRQSQCPIDIDVVSSLNSSPSRRHAVLDGLDRVIRIGSFSKALSASIRCGYIAARADWIEGLTDLQVATSFGGPSPVAAELIALWPGRSPRRSLS